MPIDKRVNLAEALDGVSDGATVFITGFGGAGFPNKLIRALRDKGPKNLTIVVNSATHLWGSRRYETRDDSTNNWWVALLTFGEGWHNNHHAHPVSARHGLAWYEFDMNWIGISTLKALGLAWDVKVAKVRQEMEEEAA